MSQRWITASQYVFALAGIAVLAYGIAMTVSTPWGVSAWDVLHLGITRHTTLSLGQAGQISGLVIIAAAWLIRRRYVALLSILNAVLVGWFIDFFLAHGLVPYVSGFLGLVYLELGVVVFAAGMALYLTPDLGAGPRDALMMSLSDVFRVNVGPVRIVLDILAVATGAMLGGPFGIGTILAALTLGPWVQCFFRPARRLLKHFLHHVETAVLFFTKERSAPRPFRSSDEPTPEDTIPPTSRKPRPK